MKQFIIIGPSTPMNWGGVSPPYSINQLLEIGDYEPDEIDALCHLEVDERMEWDESHIQRVADSLAGTWLVTWWTLPVTGIMKGIQLEHTVNYPTQALAERARRYIDMLRTLPAEHRRDFLGDEYQIVGTIRIDQQ